MTGTGWGTVSYAKDASGLLGVGETVKGGLVPTELLVMEWPEVLAPHVHVPRSGGPPPPRDLSHRASLERKQEGPCQEASVLTGVLQAAPGESGPRKEPQP